jgi:mRNA interferase HicA
LPRIHFFCARSSKAWTAFIRKIKRLGRTRNVTVLLRAERGKGSHTTLYYGSKYAVMPSVRDDLKTGALHGILD